MAKHGYTLENGWQDGVCAGAEHRPIEIDRAPADATVAAVLREVELLRTRHGELESGREQLTFVPSPTYSRHQRPLVEYATLKPHEQEAALASALHEIKHRADSGKRFAALLQAVTARVHGTPLLQVQARTAPPQILNGERRASGQTELRAISVRAGRVDWLDDTGRRGSMSMRSWRALPIVEPAP